MGGVCGKRCAHLYWSHREPCTRRCCLLWAWAMPAILPVSSLVKGMRPGHTLHTFSPCRVDESHMTGESDDVIKSPGVSVAGAWRNVWAMGVNTKELIGVHSKRPKSAVRQSPSRQFPALALPQTFPRFFHPAPTPSLALLLPPFPPPSTHPALTSFPHPPPSQACNLPLSSGHLKAAHAPVRNCLRLPPPPQTCACPFPSRHPTCFCPLSLIPGCILPLPPSRTPAPSQASNLLLAPRYFKASLSLCGRPHSRACLSQASNLLLPFTPPASDFACFLKSASLPPPSQASNFLLP